MNERRRHQRFRKRLTVRYGQQDLDRAGFTFDVSQGGAFVVSKTLPQIGQRLHVQLFFDRGECLFLEGLVVREKLVAPELRQAVDGGFGVCFLRAEDLLEERLPGPLRLRYSSPNEFRRAYANELRLGRVFVPTARALEEGATADVELRFAYAEPSLSLPARVVRASRAEGGVELAFVDPPSATLALGRYLSVGSTTPQ